MPLAPLGLSPRVRGNPQTEGQLVEDEGSIPACAGEPPAKKVLTRRRRVYPRVCGGTRRGAPLRPPLRGLSPRVRGNPTAPACRPFCARSIPACAGEPAPGSPLSPLSPLSPVYPRVCGGTAGHRSGTPSWWGLSPRVRGNHFGVSVVGCRVRSIPACAGEPSHRPHAGGRGWVYPRVCGGTQVRRRDCNSCQGLSPRVRGNRRGIRPILRW